MNRIKDLIQSKAYNRRFILTYSLLIIVFLNLIYLLLNFSPAGLRTDEINQLSNLANWDLTNLVNWPFLLIQKLVISFGLTTFSAKISSIIFSILTIGLLYYSFAEITNRKNALISLIMFSLASSFLIIIQDATPIIFLLFNQSMFLFLIIKIKQKLAQKQSIDKLLIILSVFSGIACYNPMFCYFLVTNLIIIAFHPKLRLIFNNIKRKTKLIVVASFLLSILPLIITIFYDQQIAATLLAVNQTSFDIKDNLWQIIDFTNTNPDFISQPIFNLGLIFIGLLGIIPLVKNFHTVKSFFVISTAIASFIFGLFIINDLRIIILFPSLLLISEGNNWLTDYWMKIFPYNPYARFIGSIMIFTTVAILAFSSAQTTLLSYKYNFNLASQFNNDLNLALTKINPDKTLIVGSQAEANFYKLAGFKTKLYRDDLKINQKMILTSLAYQKSQKLIPQTVIVNDRNFDSVRFYVY